MTKRPVLLWSDGGRDHSAKLSATRAAAADPSQPVKLLGADPLASKAAGQPLRIVLYSHDAMGLGHIRRNLLVAQMLAGADSGAAVLLVSGVREAGTFHLPPGVDLLTLPALRKDGNGQYDARNLPIGKDNMVSLRSATLRATLAAFDPDVLIVDKIPRGVCGELEEALEYLRGRHTRIVLGLRDILDEPETVRIEWAREGNEAAIRRYYHAIWVYGDPRLYDLAREYALPADIAAMISYSGYLDSRQRIGAAASEQNHPVPPDLGDRRMLLCTVGGGEDGARLAETFARAMLPAGSVGVILTGPFMPERVRARLTRLAARRDDLLVLDFVPEATDFVERADRIVAMGGYNTTTEILSFGKKALIVPRVTPRQEQLIRAERLMELGLVAMLHPDLLTPAALSRWLCGPAEMHNDAHRRLDFCGLERLPKLLEELITPPRQTRPIFDQLEALYAAG